MDLVTRKWITELISIEETSTQVQVVFMDALELEGLMQLIEARQGPATARPVLPRCRRRAAADSARDQRQRAADDVGLDAGVHGDVRDRAALRPARHPD
jgi:hypothetical protein